MGPDFSIVIEAVNTSKLVDATLSISVGVVGIVIIRELIYKIWGVLDNRAQDRAEAEDKLWGRRTRIFERHGVTPKL